MLKFLNLLFKIEFYRRKAAPYEDKKAAIEGDLKY